jgi:hypothetical protein
MSTLSIRFSEIEMFFISKMNSTAPCLMALAKSIEDNKVLDKMIVDTRKWKPVLWYDQGG